MWAKQPPPAHGAHLCLVHADEALVDLGPGGHGTDVPELVGVLSKGTRLHLKETQSRAEGAGPARKLVHQQ